MNFAPQVFELADIRVVFFLVVLEALLSADNALVLAIMVRHLPNAQRQRALLYGLAGAFVFRLVAILLAQKVLELWWLQVIGAGYLLFLPIKHFVVHNSPKKIDAKKAGFWATVIAVEVADIAFAIDSVLAGVATVGNRPEKIWVVYFGAIIGVVLLRFAAGAFIKLLERYPLFDHVAYLLVGWVGVKLAFMGVHNLGRANPSLNLHVQEMPTTVFWGVLMAIAVIGSVLAVRNARPESEVHGLDTLAEEVEDVSDLSIDEDPPKP